LAISYVGGATGVSVGNTDVSVSLTALTGGSDSAPIQDDLVIFAYNIADADGVNLDLVTVTAGYTEVADLIGDGTQDANLGVFYKFMGATPDTTAVGEGSLGGTDTAIQGAVMVFRGVALVADGGPFDVASTTNTGTTVGDPVPSSIDTTGAAGIWVVIVGADAHTANVNGTFTGPTNYTVDFITVGNQDITDGIIGMGYNSAPSDPEGPGTITTATTATGWCAVTMALKAVSIVNATATPATIAAIAATPAPTLLATAITTPATVAAVSDVPGPTISGTAVVAPASVDSVSTIPTPTILTGGDVNVAPSTVTAVGDVPAPTLSGTATVTPAAVAATGAVPAPTISGTAIVTPSAVAAVGSVSSPTLTSTAVATPATVATISDVLLPPVIGGTGDKAVTPTTVGAIVAVPTPMPIINPSGDVMVLGRGTLVVTPGQDLSTEVNIPIVPANWTQLADEVYYPTGTVTISKTGGGTHTPAEYLFTCYAQENGGGTAKVGSAVIPLVALSTETERDFKTITRDVDFVPDRVYGEYDFFSTSKSSTTNWRWVANVKKSGWSEGVTISVVLSVVRAKFS